MSAVAASFEEFCRVWPMRSDEERAEAEIAFGELPADDRAETIVGCDAFRSLAEHLDFPVEPAALVLRERKHCGFAYLARTERSVRRLMRGEA